MIEKDIPYIRTFRFLFATINHNKATELIPPHNVDGLKSLDGKSCQD